MTACAFVFAGGGTGGHIFPNVAIAAELESLGHARANMVFVCSDKPVDSASLSPAGVRFEPIPARPPVISPRGMARLARSWGRCVRRSREVIQELRGGPGVDEVVVVATGGYVSAPVVMAARAEKAPVALINLDARPGKANRWMARGAKWRWCVALPGAEAPGGWEGISPIVRAGATPPGDQAACRELAGLAPERPVLMVLGGSQGARSVDLFMDAFVQSDVGARALGGVEGGGGGGWQVLHQCWPQCEPVLKAAYARAGLRARVTPFVEDVGVWWGAADVAVARAGAGAVAEAWASRTPAMFMPYPFHRDRHQAANARPLVAAGGALVVTDHIAPGANLAAGGEGLARLLSDAARRDAMRRALASLGTPDGAVTVARALSE